MWFRPSQYNSKNRPVWQGRTTALIHTPSKIRHYVTFSGRICEQNRRADISFVPARRPVQAAVAAHLKRPGAGDGRGRGARAAIPCLPAHSAEACSMAQIRCRDLEVSQGGCGLSEISRRRICQRALPFDRPAGKLSRGFNDHYFGMLLLKLECALTTEAV